MRVVETYEPEEEEEESEELQEAYAELVAALNDYKIFGWPDKLEEALKLAG